MTAVAIDLSAVDLEGRGPEAVLEWAYSTFRRVAIVASFQAESSVLIHMASAIVERPEVVTLDTGRLPQETYDLMDRIQRRYPIHLHVHTPDPDEIAELVAAGGPNLFRESVELRRRCCEVRKTLPLARALSRFDAWVTGLRRDQSGERARTPIVRPDPAHGGMAKIAPLATWRRQRVWDYIHQHGLEYHELYEQGYTSIGCAPCTRAIGSGEDERAGRWWWERSEPKECGLHWSDDGQLASAKRAV